MKRMMIAVTGASMLALAGAAAAESFELSDAQLDGVTAGATAVFQFTTIAVGDFGTISGAEVAAITDTTGAVTGFGQYASVQLFAASSATSVLGGAAAQTIGRIGSSLP